MLLPFVIACLVLLFSEGRRLLSNSPAVRSPPAWRTHPRHPGFFFWVVLLFSGVTPEIDTRLEGMDSCSPSG